MDYVRDSQQNGYDPDKFYQFAKRNSEYFDRSERYVGPLLIAFFLLLAFFGNC